MHLVDITIGLRHDELGMNICPMYASYSDCLTVFLTRLERPYNWGGNF